jgi:hypothetical protein
MKQAHRWKIFAVGLILCIVIGTGWVFVVTFPDTGYLTCWQQTKQNVITRFGPPTRIYVEDGQENLLYQTGVNTVTVSLNPSGRVRSVSIVPHD